MQHFCKRASAFCHQIIISTNILELYVIGKVHIALIKTAFNKVVGEIVDKINERIYNMLLQPMKTGDCHMMTYLRSRSNMINTVM